MTLPHVTRLDQLEDYVASATEPTSPSAGDLWLDTANDVWKRWDGTAWVEIGAGGGGSVAVDDSGTEVVAAASRLNFGTGLSVTDDTGGAVTIDADGGSSGGGGVESTSAVAGQATINDPATSVAVEHGVRAPEVGEVQLTPVDDTDGWLDGAASTKYAVRDLTADDFTIALDQAPGTGKHVTFGWMVLLAVLQADSVKAYAEALATESAGSITDGGQITIDGQVVGNHDYVVKNGPITLDAGNPFVTSDWFSNRQDSHSAWAVVNGNLTIDAGQVFRPSARKLFTVLYVDGDLTVNGTISMTARGANHGEDGSNLDAAALLIAAGTFSGVIDPNVPSAGAAGGASVSSTNAGNDGTDGTDGATGGGGSGASVASDGSGAGATGTGFSGGPGGGASRNSGVAEDGLPRGGKGGDAQDSGGSSRAAGGGAGNPGGAGVSLGSGSGEDGDDGTGGVLVVIATGELSGSGSIEAEGSDGGDAGGENAAGGAGSGGGSVTVLYGTDTSTITPSAAGGAAGQALGGGSLARDGGAGGDGTARKLALA